jgi:hypothetical protein
MEKKEKDYLEKEYKENKKEAKIEMVSKLANRQKRGKKYLTEARKGKKATDIDAALNTFETQEYLDADKRFEDLDLISDRKLSDREGSFKKGGLVKKGKPKIAKKGWR